jgi:hypothetical protein
MKSIISVIFSMFCITFVSAFGVPMLPSDKVEVPTTKVKRSRGKGKGSKPHFAKFM